MGPGLRLGALTALAPARAAALLRALPDLARAAHHVTRGFKRVSVGTALARARQTMLCLMPELACADTVGGGVCVKGSADGVSVYSMVDAFALMAAQGSASV